MVKKKTSLIKRMIGLLVSVLIITTLVTGVLRYFDIRSSSIEFATQTTTQAASQVALMLDGDDVEACMANPNGETSGTLKTRLRDICNGNNLIYLYICIPDFENMTATFVQAAAAETADKSEINYENYVGKVIPVKEATMAVAENVWNGKDDATVRIQNDYGDFVVSFQLIGNEIEKVALVGAGYDTKTMVQDGVAELTFKMLVSFLVWIAVFVTIGYYLKKKMVTPILHISDKMRVFTSDFQNNEFQPLSFHTGDEIEQVADSFNILSSELTTYISDAKRFAAQEAKIATELDVARKIQYGVVSPLTEKDISKTLHLSCRMNPARSVGGDFYDCFDLKDGVHCLVIADVSGKGIGAAMFMMLVKAILHEKLMSNDDLAVALSEANNEIYANNPETMFATVFVALIEDNANRIRYVNGGHNAPVLVHQGVAEELSVASGIALGVFDDLTYTQQSVPFEENDALVMFTDGVNEAVNEQKEFFGMEALIETVQNCYDNQTNYCDEVLNRLDAFKGDAEQFDDITLVAVHKTGTD